MGIVGATAKTNSISKKSIRYVALLRIIAKPRSGKNALAGFTEAGLLSVHVTAPPADGLANVALIKVLAKALDVPKSTIHITRGENASVKTFDFSTLTDPELDSRLAKYRQG